MFRTIVVPLDGSPLAEHALATATMLAERAKAGIQLVRAHQLMLHDLGDQVALDEAMREEAQEYLERTAVGIHAETGLDARTVVLDGPPTQVICDHLRAQDAPLLVMSTHGRTGFSRAWLGSVADGVVRTVSSPVLLLRPEEAAGGVLEPIGAFNRMLVPLDGSGYAEQVVPPALALAELTGAQVLLLEVVKPVFAPAFMPAMEYAVAYAPPEEYSAAATDALVERAADYVSSLAAKLRRQHPTVNVQSEVRTERSPAQVIIETAAANASDVVALATHGRGMSRLVVGSVADKVLRGGPRALLVVRPQ
ncbi:MAG: universal stress protein [Gemmatimonadaceae bacterium]|nr:universal stress protein [Gemmatimonadaceae bacterium]